MNMSETVTCYFLKWVCHHYVAGLPAIFFSEKKVLKVIFCDFKGFKGPNFCEIKGFKGPFSRFLVPNTVNLGGSKSLRAYIRAPLVPLASLYTSLFVACVNITYYIQLLK